MRYETYEITKQKDCVTLAFVDSLLNRDYFEASVTIDATNGNFITFTSVHCGETTIMECYTLTSEGYINNGYCEFFDTKEWAQYIKKHKGESLVKGFDPNTVVRVRSEKTDTNLPDCSHEEDLYTNRPGEW